MSMQRDTPLPRIQPAHGWAGSMGQARPSSWCRARKPDCRCNGTRRCRASNPRRVGEGRRNRAGFLVVGCTGARKPPAREGCNGRAKRLPCQACCATTHRLSTPEVGLFTPLIHACRVSMRRLTVQTCDAKNPESDSNCRTCPVWHSAIASCHARGFAPLALSAGYINKEIIILSLCGRGFFERPVLLRIYGAMHCAINSGFTRRRIGAKIDARCRQGCR